jgi:glutamyl-Q tRNA(Asp) synthetase
VNERGEKLSKQTFAAPVDPARPLPALVAALSFLGQQPPRELARSDIVSLWKWAMANWRLDRVPRGGAIRAPVACER